MSEQEVIITKPKNLLVRFDTDLSLAFYKSVGSRLPRAFYKALEHTGSGLLWLPLAVALFLAPNASQKIYALAANLFLGLLIDLAYVGLQKGIVRRPRPVYNNASDFLLVVKVDQYSFPSGHSARVTFLAIFALMWLRERHEGLTVALCVWAAVTAISRCLMGRHYLGDVLVGAVTGLATAATLSKGTFTAEQCWISEQQAQQWHYLAMEQWQSLTSKR